MSNSTSLFRNVIKNIYIHIPFCLKKCSYCDFPVHAIGTQNQPKQWNDTIQNDYVNALIAEMDIYFDRFAHRIQAGLRLQSLNPDKVIFRLLRHSLHRRRNPFFTV